MVKISIMMKIILFVTTKNNQEINDEKINLIKSRIKKNCSPKHVPAIIIKAPEIPRTKSGKIVELAVRQVINGEKINNKEAIANPEALKFYENLPQLKNLKNLTMKKLIIFYINATFFMMIGVVFADVVSKDPNYLKRGKIDKVHIANYLKKGIT